MVVPLDEQPCVPRVEIKRENVTYECAGSGSDGTALILVLGETLEDGWKIPAASDGKVLCNEQGECKIGSCVPQPICLVGESGGVQGIVAIGPWASGPWWARNGRTV